VLETSLYNGYEHSLNLTTLDIKSLLDNNDHGKDKLYKPQITNLNLDNLDLTEFIYKQTKVFKLLKGGESNESLVEENTQELTRHIRIDSVLNEKKIYPLLIFRRNWIQYQKFHLVLSHPVH
jgi:hypothetical protein